MGDKELITKKQKSLASQKGQVTRAITKLDDLLKTPEPDCDVIEELVETVNKRFDKVEKLQDELCELADEDTIMAVNEEVEKYLEAVQEIKVKAKKKLSKRTTTGQQTPAVVGTTVQQNQVKLPEIRLPKFSGNVLEWPRFWDLFLSTIDQDPKLSHVHKFTYLTGQLEGEAADVIKELRISSDNYQKAKDLLKERYERPDTLIFKHIQALLHLEVDKSKKDNLSRLKACMDQVNIHIRSLEALGIDGSSYGVILVPLILSRLPQEIVEEWSRKSKGKERDLKYLLDVCNEEMQIKERTQSVKYTEKPTEKPTAENTTGEKRKFNSRKSSPKRSTAAALTATEDVPQCIFCDRKGHDGTECRTVRRFNWNQIQEKIQKKGVCYKCLRPGHVAKNCQASCTHCGRGHHSNICRPRESETQGSKSKSQANEDKGDTQDTEQKTDHSNSATNVSCVAQSSQDIIMQTATIKAAGQNKILPCNVLFDSGSNQTYIKKEVADKLGCKTVKTIQHQVIVFGGNKSQFTQKAVREVNLIDLWGKTHTIHAIETENVCAPLMRPAIPKNVILRGLTFADQSPGKITIDILLGLDYYWEFFGSQVSRLTDTLVAHNTPFGNIISGQLNTHNSKDSVLSHNLFVMSTSSTNLQDAWENGLVLTTKKEDPSKSIKEDVSCLWSLEWCGADANQSEEDAVYKHFKETLEYNENERRYVTQLPWKPQASELMNNEESTKQRCIKQYRKLTEEQKDAYGTVFKEWETEEIIEEVPANEVQPSDNRKVFYLPHRPVIKTDRLTTKIRPVFDGSAKSANGVSINDVLHTGPKLQNDISDILMRFRTHEVALNADISKAFLQIELCTEDRDACRFFLPSEHGSFRIMRFRRLPFGLNSSPFILNGTLQVHLDKYSSKAAEEMKKNLYVDDLLSGEDTVTAANQLYTEANKIVNDASMQLSKWRSNVKEFKDGETPESKVLGLFWDSNTDEFQYSGIEIPTDVVITKRLILSCIARVFDPLGYLSPYTIKGKILFQRAWSNGYDWDEEITDSEINQEFKKWIEGLKEIKTQFKVNRKYTENKTFRTEEKKLHVYCDASEEAYGAAIYLETSEGLSLILAKSKVAPLKKICLPRLELIACVLGAQLLEKVQTALDLQKVPYQCYTDNTIALCQIRKEPSNWKPFVANRVSTIQQITDPSKWKHIDGIRNPADMLTRGFKATKLVRDMKSWLQPDLVITAEFYPESESTTDEDTVLHTTTAEKEVKDPIIDTTRSSRLTKVVRAMGWVNRFIRNCQKKLRGSAETKGDISANEFNSAKETLTKQLQEQEFHAEIELLKNQRSISKNSKLYPLTPFLDDRGILRIKGRLQNADLTYEERHPVILPKCWTATLIIRDYHRNMKHPGVSSVINAIRKEYWILGLRKLAKEVHKECISCQKIHASACNQSAPALPADRVNRQHPFAKTGIDFAGPLYVTDSEHKQYICLFTCFVTRAVHLELTPSVNLPDFLQAFRRFTARRGIPSDVYSDNAKTFVSASEKLGTLYGDMAPKWHFITPRSPWRGGAWERMVRSVKLHLKKTLGSAKITKAELETVLSEIEFIVNSRPLTTVTDNPEDLVPLSPADFLLNKTPIDISTPVTARQSLSKSSQYLQKFWKVWSTAYLKTLPNLVPHFTEKSPLQVGDVVLIAEDNIPRLQWPLARVIELIESSDELVRTVRLQTAKGIKLRPVQRLHLLEGVAHDEPPEVQPQLIPITTKQRKKKVKIPSSSTPDPPKDNSVTTRSGRRTHRPIRYD